MIGSTDVQLYVISSGGRLCCYWPNACVRFPHKCDVAMASPHVAITDFSSPLFALFVSTVSRYTPCIRLCYCCWVPLTCALISFCVCSFTVNTYCGFTVLPKGHAFSCQTVRVVCRSELNWEAFRLQFGSWNWIEVVQRMQNISGADC